MSSNYKDEQLLYLLGLLLFPNFGKSRDLPV
jgi:hypothetical protein